MNRNATYGTIRVTMKSIITFILLAFISLPCFAVEREDIGALIAESDTRIQKLESLLLCVKGTPDAEPVIHEIYLAELDRLGYLTGARKGDRLLFRTRKVACPLFEAPFCFEA
jgi:hypothetical protein